MNDDLDLLRKRVDDHEAVLANIVEILEEQVPRIDALAAIAANCAAALSEKGLLHPERAMACAVELKRLAEISEARPIHADTGSAVAENLHAIALLIEQRASS